jgi:hypothetical protein
LPTVIFSPLALLYWHRFYVGNIDWPGGTDEVNNMNHKLVHAELESFLWAEAIMQAVKYAQDGWNHTNISSRSFDLAWTIHHNCKSWSVSRYNFSFYDLIAYGTKSPTSTDLNTFLTVSFSVNSGGGSGNLTWCCSTVGEGERWC